LGKSVDLIVTQKAGQKSEVNIWYLTIKLISLIL